MVPAQEIAASRLQAISEGRDLVQGSPTGYSAVIDSGGRVLDRSSLGRRQVLVDDVHLRSGRTIYERLGDLPILTLRERHELCVTWNDTKCEVPRLTIHQMFERQVQLTPDAIAVEAATTAAAERAFAKTVTCSHPPC